MTLDNFRIACLRLNENNGGKLQHINKIPIRSTYMEENGCWHDIEMIKLKDDPLYELKGIQRIIEECTNRFRQNRTTTKNLPCDYEYEIT